MDGMAAVKSEAANFHRSGNRRKAAERIHVARTSVFDVYADAFGYKLFSARDSVGQLLAMVHGLQLTGRRSLRLRLS